LSVEIDHFGVVPDVRGDLDGIADDCEAVADDGQRFGARLVLIHGDDVAVREDEIGDGVVVCGAVGKCFRIRPMTSALSISAMMRIVAPQLGHSSGSTS
jgi:hypothetical protein